MAATSLPIQTLTPPQLHHGPIGQIHIEIEFIDCFLRGNHNVTRKTRMEGRRGSTLNGFGGQLVCLTTESLYLERDWETRLKGVSTGAVGVSIKIYFIFTLKYHIYYYINGYIN